ncbi:aminotransferase class III-fold pyridoxal phosphate-dependent enzyme [Micromonospora echinospora]|uniref:aminotransferase class III-fold pyridoxal phosphate-dependent enzyme n=1 Tax=Micromonospora echinospora TaxID=1877 RepID=UPI0037A4C5B3
MTIDIGAGKLLAQEPTCPRDADGRPRVFVEGSGAYLTDPDGRRWVDFDNARGSVILGHGDEEVAEAIARAARGRSGVGTAWSPMLDSLLGQLQEVCGGDVVGLYRTGTAALRSVTCAVRDARDRSIVLSSGYHGYDPMWHCDEPFTPNQHGIVEFLFDLDVLAEWLSRPEQVAAVVISPDHMHLGERWYTEFTRLTKEADVPVIADEVKVGLRYRAGLSTPLLDPAVWIVAKCLANGSPVAAVGGDAHLLAALEDVSFTSYFEPTAMAAATTTLRRMATGEPQQAIRAAGDRFIAHTRAAFAGAGVPIDLAGNGNLFQFVCADDEVADAFHAASAAEGLLFFEGDNQTPSAAFTDEVVEDACGRIDRVAAALSGRFTDRELTEESWYASAWGAMDGLADRPRTREETTAIVERLWED